MKLKWTEMVKCINKEIDKLMLEINNCYKFGDYGYLDIIINDNVLRYSKKCTNQSSCRKVCQIFIRRSLC